MRETKSNNEKLKDSMEKSVEGSNTTPKPNYISLNPQFRENEGALVQSLLEATDYGILLSGLNRQDILANRKLGELFYCEPQAIVENEPEGGRQLAHAVVSDPDDFDRKLVETYSDPLLSYEDELELVTDPPRTLRRFTGPVLDREGEPLARLWTFLDISETKRLQLAIREQLERRTDDYNATQEILEAMNDICRLNLHRHNLDDLIVSILKRVCKITGHDSMGIFIKDPHRDGLDSFVTLKDGAVRKERLSIRFSSCLTQLHCRPKVLGDRHFELFTGGQNFELFTGQIDSLNRLLKCEKFGVAELHSEKGIVGAVAIGFGSESKLNMQDPFRYAQLDSLIDQIAQSLESHRLQADLHAAMKSLSDTQRRMVEMEKLKTAGTLAASVAHDIRNILSTMQMEVELLPVETDSLQDQLNRFSALTHRLLAYSRPQVLETVPTDIVEALKRVVSMIQGQADIQGVQVVIAFPDSYPLISADASQLEHLLINLCLNALQAMPRGGELNLGMSEISNWVLITVSDTGSGIAPEILPRLFDPFFTTRATGFGLGLFSCKSIVEEHGGELEAESIPEKGACFTIRLPAIIG